jgi:1-aminocyclopropane-1-carboxylate deaminase
VIDTSKSIVQKVQFFYEKTEPFSFDIKRDDLIDPVISGNKWRKLKYNIEKVKQEKYNGILTFGGAFSNHLIATAQAAHDNRIDAVGIVRGDELNANSNETLRSCEELGMQLVFISRDDYKRRHEKEYLSRLNVKFPNLLMVPEGGANFYGAIGCQEIISTMSQRYDHIYLAAGTGTTAAGMLSAIGSETTLHAVSALKGDFLEADIRKLLWSIVGDDEHATSLMKNLDLNTSSHCGGYGKTTNELFDIIRSFHKQTQIALEPIYTGKVLFAMIEDIKSGIIKSDQNVLMIHTGGLQGGKSFVTELPFLTD